MPSLEQLLANIQGVKDIPTTVRKSAHTHSDIFTGAVKQERSLVKRLNGLVRAVREEKITKETAMKSAEQLVSEHQVKLSDIALRRAKRSLGKSVSTLSPEVAERLNRIRDETLKSFQTVLNDL